MASLDTLPIRRKLTLAITLASASSLLCAFLVFFGYEIWSQREYAADAGAAQLMGNARPMINALRRLGGVDANDLPKDMQAMGIAGGAASLFASHPSLEERIAALQQQ